MSKRQRGGGLYVFESDYHDGSSVGLTAQPHNDVQRELLRRHDECVAEWRGCDCLIVNGDAVDGPQRKGRRSDLTCDDLAEQERDAVKLILPYKAKRVIIIGGSDYHVVDAAGQEHERSLVARLQDSGQPAEYCHLLRRKLQGWFAVSSRHFIPGTQALNSSGTAVERKRIHELMWTHIASTARINLHVFAHRHRFRYEEDEVGRALVLPGWQCAGGSFGELRCDGLISVGSVAWRVGATEEEGASWESMRWHAVAGVEELASM